MDPDVEMEEALEEDNPSGSGNGSEEQAVENARLRSGGGGVERGREEEDEDEAGGGPSTTTDTKKQKTSERIPVDVYEGYDDFGHEFNDDDDYDHDASYGADYNSDHDDDVDDDDHERILRTASVWDNAAADSEEEKKEVAESDDEEDEEEEGEEDAFLETFEETEDDVADTTMATYRQGKDIQGIPWVTTPWTREAYRAKRDAEYTSYYNREQEVKAAVGEITAAALPTYSSPHTRRFFFYRNWRRVHTTIVHFQLRNLIWPTSSNEVYYVSNNQVRRFNSVARGRGAVGDIVIDVSAANRSRIPGMDSVNVCTMCAKYGVVAAGGFGGELVVRRIPHLFHDIGNDTDTNTGRTIRSGAHAITTNKTKNSLELQGIRVTHADNGITNAIDVYTPATGNSTRLVCSNNDQAVRVFDVEGLCPVSTFSLPWAVNCCVASPQGGRLYCAVGDDPEGVLLDPRSVSSPSSTRGTSTTVTEPLASHEVVAKLTGHYDFSFAAAWHPDGNIVATGNQDLTTRIFDLRVTQKPLCVLKSHVGAVRSLRFSPDGRTLAVAEPADYVTLYDVGTGYRTCQSIDLFGELAGVGFTPGSNRFYIAVADVHYASLVQYNSSSSGSSSATGVEGYVEGLRGEDAWRYERKRRGIDVDWRDAPVDDYDVAWDADDPPY